MHAYGVCASPAFFYRHCDALLAELGATPDVLGCSAEGLLRRGSHACRARGTCLLARQPGDGEPLGSARAACQPTSAPGSARGRVCIAHAACPARCTTACRIVQAQGEGYAQSLPEELACVAEVAAATGVILDPV